MVWRLRERKRPACLLKLKWRPRRGARQERRKQILEVEQGQADLNRHFHLERVVS